MNSDIKEHDDVSPPHGLSSAESASFNDLLCCPFCGGSQPQKQKATTPDGEFHSWKIWCRQCNCRTGPEKSLSNAIARWNLRRT